MPKKAAGFFTKMILKWLCFFFQISGCLIYRFVFKSTGVIWNAGEQVAFMTFIYFLRSSNFYSK